MQRGYFITIEGGDGSGKSTVLNFLVKQIIQQGWPLFTTREPGGTEVGEKIREILLTPDLKPNALSETFLFFAARAQVVEEIKQKLAQGKIVLCDRFADSTFAYQGGGRGLEITTLQEVNLVATGGLMPDLTILLNVDPEIGLTRCQGDTRFEQEALDFHSRLCETFRQLAQAEPERFEVINSSSLSQEKVCNKAWQIVQERLSSFQAQQ